MAEHSDSLSVGFMSSLKKSLAEEFSGCKTIAVKMHFGEVGNKTSLRPGDVKPFTELLKELGLDFFLYDTSVAYPGPRANPGTHKLMAKAKGWGKLGKIRTDDDCSEVEGEHLTYEVAEPLVQADGVLVLSHVKGHTCSGFGGAIKNLGMGALSKRSKKAIHAGGEPLQEGVCEQCGACEAACPIKAIKVTDKPHIRQCWGCSNCGYVCPTGYLAPKVAGFDDLLADGAFAAAKNFKRQWYVNIVNNISKMCDCMPFGGKVIADDCGFVHGGDMGSVDRKSQEVVKAKAGEVFLGHNLKDGLRQVEAVERLISGS